MPSKDYYQLTNFNQVFPNFWSLVHPREIRMVPEEDLINLNYMLEFLLPTFDEDSLSEDCRSTYNYIKQVYDLRVKQYWENFYYQQQQQQQYYQYQAQHQPQYQPQYQHNWQESYSGYQSGGQQYHSHGYAENQPETAFANSNQHQSQKGNSNFRENQHSGNNFSTPKQYVEKKVEEPPVQVKQIKKPEPEPVVQPPKPVVEPPKPMKFSISEIKQWIAKADKEKMAKLANPELVKEVEEMKKWEKKQITVQTVPETTSKYNKKQSVQNANSNTFSKGAKYNPDANKESDFAKGSKFVKNAQSMVIDIQMGKNQSLQTRIVKKQLKQKAAKQNYAKAKEDQELSLDYIEKSKRSIQFDLNRVAPENLKEISKELAPYAKENLEVCKVLINEIIQKAWTQPKYASSYAKLCSNFCKIKEQEFKFDYDEDKGEKSQKTEKNQSGKSSQKNNFKLLLLEKVQHTFDKKEIEIPEFEDEFAKETFLRDTKKHMLGNIKFIAELIKLKVIKKKLIKYCIQNLLQSFFQEYYLYNKTGNFRYSFYEFQFQTLIEFLENLGEFYEKIDDKEDKEKDEKSANTNPEKYLAVQKAVKKICEANEEPPKEIEYLDELSADEYFKIFIIIDKSILSKKQSRVSFLLQNLEERRDNKWKKHNVEAEGPMRLKDLKNDDENQPEKKVMNDLAALDEKMSKMLKMYQENDAGWKKVYDKVCEYKTDEIAYSYFKLVAEEKKEAVQKRLEVFDTILEKNYQAKQFKMAWTKAVGNLALLSSDLPFCSAALGKILLRIEEKKGIRYSEFFIKFNEDTQEDEYFFMDEILQKAYYYSKNDEIIEFLIDKKPKPKLSHLL